MKLLGNQSKGVNNFVTVLSEADVDAIRLSMAYAYLDTLGK